MKRIPSFLLVVAFLGLGRGVYAQADLDEARTRFQRGVELYKEGSLDAALAEFNKAYEIAPNYRVLYNIAQVQTERHDYVAALKMLEKYLDQGGADVPPERRDQVTKEIGVMKGRVAELSVVTPVEGAELLVDGVSAGKTPLGSAVLVSAGVRQLELRKEGYEPATRSLTVAGGDTVRVDFDLKPVRADAPAPSPGATGMSGPAAPPEHDEAPKTAEHTSKAPMWITLATTGVLVGGAVTFAVLTSNADKNLDRELDRFPGDPSAIERDKDSLKRYALFTDIFTAASVVSGGFFVYFALSSSSSSGGHAKTTNVRLAPAGTGLRVIGNF